MNSKEKIIAEIDSLPEYLLTNILKQITDFKSQEVTKQKDINESTKYSLEGSVIYYHNPFESTTSEDDWDVLT